MSKLLLGLTILLVGCTSPPPIPSPYPTGSASSTTSALPSDSPTSDARCQDMTHVYNPSRLMVMQSCVHVSGIVEIVRIEPDGDYHTLVHVDPDEPTPYGSWVNIENLNLQHGDLVTEPVCEHSVTQADAVSACVGYTNSAKVPSVGQHVRVSGPWVLDKPHGWFEIHPATYEVLSALADPLAGQDD